MKRTMSLIGEISNPPSKRRKLNNCASKPVVTKSHTDSLLSSTSEPSQSITNLDCKSPPINTVDSIITDLISSALNIAESTKLTKTSKSISKSNEDNGANDDDSGIDKECCICFDHIDFPITLDCGHRFCFLCLKEIRMQSATSFNPLTFQCSDPSSNDTDSNHNNHSGNGTFCCPYCRRSYDVTVIDDAKIKRTEWMESISNHNNKSCDDKKRCEDQDEQIVIWQYSGRKGGWWAYHGGHQLEIEKGYQQFMGSIDGKENGVEDENGIDIADEMRIEIGVREYVIDFERMIQFDSENENRKRNIRRVVEGQGELGDLKRSDSLKGCAGKFFEKQEK